MYWSDSVSSVGATEVPLMQPVQDVGCLQDRKSHHLAPWQRSSDQISSHDSRFISKED